MKKIVAILFVVLICMFLGVFVNDFREDKTSLICYKINENEVICFEDK